LLYPTDVSDKEWAQIKEFFEQKKKFGRPLSYDRRNMVNAIFYVTKTGCQWRMLPNDFPAWLRFITTSKSGIPKAYGRKSWTC